MIDINEKIKMIKRAEDVNHVNTELLYADRDLTDLIVNCYKHLKNAHLCAYELSISTNLELFYCNVEKYLYKKKKNSRVLEMEDIQANNDDLFDVSIDISDTTKYLTLKLKYIVEPELIEKKYKYSSIINTINNFQRETNMYKNVDESIIQILNRELDKIPETERNMNYSLDYISDDLFLKEKIILIPMYDNKRHIYIVDNAKYYGVFVNNNSGRLSSSGEYIMKYLTESKLVYTTYFGIDQNEQGRKTLYIKCFGNLQNPLTTMFYTLRMKISEIKKINLYDYFDLDNMEPDDRLTIMNTYDDCVENFVNDTKEVRDSKGKINKKDQFTKVSKRDIVRGIKGLFESRNIPKDSDVIKLPKYIYAGELEERILTIINQGYTPKPSHPQNIKKRITIDSYAIIKSVFKYSKEEKVLESNQTEPNPMDLVWMLYYKKKNTHSNTKTNTSNNNNTRLPERDRYINYYDLISISQFSSKGNQVGISGVLHSFIDSDRVTIKRRRLLLDESNDNPVQELSELT